MPTKTRNKSATVRKERTRGNFTTLTRRGQTVVPAAIRRRLGLRNGSKLQWVQGAGYVLVAPVPDDPIEAYAGIDRGKGLLKRLLEERRRDREREAR